MKVRTIIEYETKSKSLIDRMNTLITILMTHHVKPTVLTTSTRK